MIKKILKRVRLNFRKTNSDRKATNSYRDYRKSLLFFKRSLKNISYFKKGK